MLTIWCNTDFPADAMEMLTRGIAPNRLVFSEQRSASVLVPGAHDPLLSQANIAFGQPDPRQVIDSLHVKWVHLTSAGYRRYDTDEFRTAMRSRGSALTNSSSVYDAPCAEHALAMVLSLARRLPMALDAQRHQCIWLGDSIRAQSKLLDEQSILIYGYGAIARRLVQFLKPLRMKITGVRRSARGDEGIPMVTAEQADALLPHTDHVMNILPASADTEQFFNQTRLARISPTAYFYNIGRGATVDQDSLQSLLEQHKIAGAYLDVMTPEPLPPEHPLWKLSNCWITPHSAGGHDDEHRRLVQHFLANLKRFAGGMALVDRVC